jgi:hypothetical protein
MEPCPHTVGKCDVMRTCPCCRTHVGSRAGEANHRKSCKHTIDVEFAQMQHDHWRRNHNARAEQARRRTSAR